jgi:hypothetical protein
LVVGEDKSGAHTWSQWGVGRRSQSAPTFSWFHADHPEWLTQVADGFLRIRVRDNEERDVLQTSLYWFMRSNTSTAGVDGSLILTMCALELLSWFVIVRKRRALSESGYGRLDNATERIRLMANLLGLPSAVPAQLTQLQQFSQKQHWSDLPDAIVEARNYLVHPTQSKSGKRRERKDFPWFEIWMAAQWLLELTILRMIDYKGSYHNRTRLRDLDRIDSVPWQQPSSNT